MVLITWGWDVMSPSAESDQISSELSTINIGALGSWALGFFGFVIDFPKEF